MLTVGSRLGGYEITGLLGAGGMGEVYRARDSKLERDVAIKILPELFAANPERIARFDREAKTLAALNHPNIAAIYGVAESDDTRALVLELVDGVTLADRLARGPMSLDEALPIAGQIASALEAAHEQGVIHRDLKPANITLRPDGTVKVLDFGLAKVLEPVRAGSVDATASPTITSPVLMTNAGVILGTAAYVSPEQAKGREADKRSDVWAFGCVLYEVLTRKRAFEGDDISETLANVLKGRPDLEALPATTPRAIRRLIRRCLEKDPRQRFHHMADVRLELDDSRAGEESAARSSQPAAAGRYVLSALCGAAVGVVAALLTPWILGSSSPPAPVVRSILTTLASADLTNASSRGLAIAPDGRRVVYAAGGQLHLRSLDQAESQPLRGSENGLWPVFSPDGESVVFFVRSEIKRVSISGGAATTLTRTDGGSPAGLSWGSDGYVVFATTTSGGLFRVPALGGESSRLTKAIPGEAIDHRWPSVLPDGRGVLFAAFRGGSSRLAVVSLETGEVAYLGPTGTYPHFVRTGHVVFEEGGALRAIGFDPRRLVATSNSRAEVVPSVWIRNTMATFDIAANGSLVYVPGSAVNPRDRLVWVDRKGREEPLNLPPRAYSSVRVSPDGRRLAAAISEPGQLPELWVSDVSRPVWIRISTPDHDGGDWFPRWTPDSRRVVFSNFGSREPGLFWAFADGTGKIEPLLTIKGNSFIEARGWTRGGESLIFAFGDLPKTRVGLLSMLSSAARSWKPLIERVEGVWPESVSADGNWVVTSSVDESRRDVYIERFPDSGERHLVSTESGGWNAVWSHDGRELFYRRFLDRAMMAVPIQTTPTLAIGTPAVLFESRPAADERMINSRAWDVAPDGRFLIVKADPATQGTESRDLILVQHWDEELKRLASTN
jgi:eukaryotic-like serine/threonine-protein kinase